MAQDHSVFSNIQDNRTSSLAEQVADQINQVIIDQNINAGEKLPNEFELAARLNVGRGTIREAVKLLVARNCLEIRRGKGTFVVEKPGQIEDPLGFAYVKDKITLAVDLMELRLQLEPWVAQLAAQRIEETEKDTLRQLCEQVEHKIRSGEDHGPADKEFHAYVARCTHNSVITEIMPVITYSIEMFTPTGSSAPAWRRSGPAATSSGGSPPTCSRASAGGRSSTPPNTCMPCTANWCGCSAGRWAVRPAFR